MTFTCLKATCDSASRAEAKLSDYLPHLDVQLLPYEAGSVLVPPHLLNALEARLGEVQAQSVLSIAGLREAQPESIDSAVRWLLTHADTWRHQSNEGSAAPADAGAMTWHLDLCQVREAWTAVGGPYELDWEGIGVGQVDTGYTEHPAFGFPDSPSIDTASGRTFMSGTPDTGGRDPLSGGSGGHGTGSGSLIGAFDLSTPCLGVAPRVRLVPIRINDCVVIDDRSEEFEAAVRYLVDEAKVSVINVSMGTFGKLLSPPAMRRALDHCYERGVIAVCAAGNIPVAEWPAFPARLARSIAVAGVTRESRRWALSSYGSWVDISGPAKNIWRAATNAPQDYGFTASWGGTTFAAAMTSGAAALWLLAHSREISACYSEPWQRVEAFRQMVRQTATKPVGWDEGDGMGAGILNVAELVNCKSLPAAADLKMT